MKIGILGVGNLGGTLGVKWAEAGHSVMFGVRNPEEKRRSYGALDRPRDIEYLALGEAITESEAILIAVPSGAVPGILSRHSGSLDGKIVIDATNDFSSPSISRVSDITSSAPSARVYRAFNSLGWESIKNPKFGDLSADLFYCGSAEETARAAVEGLIREVGLGPVWLGGLDMLEVVDNLAKLWVSLAVRQGRGRHLAFKLLSNSPKSG